MSDPNAVVRFLRYVVRFPGSFFVLLFVLVSGGGHWLLGRWLLRSFPRLPRRLVGSVMAILWVLPVMSRTISRRSANPIAVNLFGVSMVELVVVAAMLPFFLLFEITRGLQARRDKTKALSKGTNAETPDPTTAPAEPVVSRRDVIERSAGLVLLGGASTALGWGMVRGRHEYVIEEVPVRIVGLPKALDGYTIAQVSDLHIGAFVGDRDLDAGFDLIRRIKPDLLVLTGDLIDIDAAFVPQLARKLRSLPRPRDGMTGIVGNHDYYAGADQVTETMRRADVQMLINQGTRIRPNDGGGFALLGVDDLWASRNGGRGPHLEDALADVPPDLPRILLSHQPTFFYQASPFVQLQLSGHTHGGQVSPGFPFFEMFMPFVKGRYTRGDSTLWVNRGFGVSGPPTRVNLPPEVTKIVLVAA